MASMNIKQRSIQFAAPPEVQDYEIVLALLVSFEENEIECVQPMPGHVWLVVFTTVALAEEATNGFILKERVIHPTLVARRFVTATVAYVPPDATLSDIQYALEQFAEVISIKELYLRDFPRIRNGKQRVVLRPRDGLPSFFTIKNYKASLFFAGRVSYCPYCEGKDHLGWDCKRKREKRCFKCGGADHFQRQCTGHKMDTEDKNTKPVPEVVALPDVSTDAADRLSTSETESSTSDSSCETVIMEHETQDKTDTSTQDKTEQETPELFTPPTPTQDKTNVTEILQELFASPTPSPQKESTPDSTPDNNDKTEAAGERSESEDMDVTQNNKRKSVKESPKARRDLRKKFGQQGPKSPKKKKGKR